MMIKYLYTILASRAMARPWWPIYFTSVTKFSLIFFSLFYFGKIFLIFLRMRLQEWPAWDDAGIRALR